jgi:hypothetical protein
MMAAFGIHDRITGWVDDQLAKEDPLGADEWGRHVTMAAVQTPQGDAIMWIILITLRGPFLGEDVIGSTSKLQANIPPEPAVRTSVTRAVENLRKAFEVRKGQGFAPGNGHGQAGLPPGLMGRKL